MKRMAIGAGAALAALSLAAPAAMGHRRTHHAHRVIDRSASNCPPGVSDPSYCLGPPVMDGKPVTARRYTSVSVPVRTSQAGDLLVAFVRSDSPSFDGNQAKVSGGGLSWTLAGRENAALGDSEVWVATAPTALTRTLVTATLTKYPDYDEVLTVIPFSNASGIGAVGRFSSLSGAPTGTITTTTDNTWVFAAGNDWLDSVHTVAGPDQTIWHHSTDTVGDTYWVQSTTNPTTLGGTPVTINDLSPTSDPFNLVLVEIL
jgi:hypothetical protein